MEMVEEGEVKKVVDQFTCQLKTSGYDRKKSREIVTSGVLGWIRKRKRRSDKGQQFYRGAASTLQGRMRKKLMDKVTWYKTREQEEDCVEKKTDKDAQKRPPKGRKRKVEENKDSEDTERQKMEDAKAVMFCPYTAGGELAKNLREAETDMEKLSGFRIKVVEDTGEKVLDRLHSSNPWRGEDFGREGCFLCSTKIMTGKNTRQDCTKRSLVYETWCQTCFQEELDKIEENEDMDEKDKEEKYQPSSAGGTR